MSTRSREELDEAIEHLARVEADPYKAPEQVEAARQAVRKAEQVDRQCMCDHPDIPFCTPHYAYGEQEGEQ